MYTEITDITQCRLFDSGRLAAIPFSVATLRPSTIPAWASMWTLAFVLWAGCKWIAWNAVAGFGTDMRRLAAAGFFLAWPGMDARPFLDRSNVISPPLRSIAQPLLRIATGLLLLGFAIDGVNTSAHPLLIGWIGMIGCLLILHFGLFDLLAHAWRRRGVHVEPIMRQPLLADSLADFWSRWNQGFRDIANILIFRRLYRRIGPRKALLATFLFSGIVHDLVLSIPARAGYGLPTLYFLLQGFGILLERSFRTDRAMDRLLKRLFMYCITILPLGLLFHSAFVLNVFVPFIRALRSLVIPNGGVS